VFGAICFRFFLSLGGKNNWHMFLFSLLARSWHWCILLSLFIGGCSQPPDGEVYLFSYFKGNGEDGLYLAYSPDGYHWEELGENQSFLIPQAGQDKLMRDPCIIRGKDGKFHMVWTVSWNEKGIGYANSEDLIHWSEQRYLPVMEHEPDARNAWAPEVYYDEAKDQYLIFWSSTITGRYPETQSEKENSYNHRMYYVTTSDFQDFSETALLYEPGFNVIDGTVVKEGDEYIMFVKDETIEPAEKNIRMTRSTQLPDGFGPAGPPITGDYWAEGPTAIKIGEQWLLYFDKYMDKKMGAVASKDLIHWEDISDRVRFPSGMRHGTVFKVTAEEFQQLKSSL